MITQFDMIAGLRDNRGKGGFWGSVLLSLVLLGAAQDVSAQLSPGMVQPPKGKDQHPAPVPAGSKKPSRVASSIVINDVITAHEGGKLVVSLATSGPTEFKEFDLDNPPRLVIDLMNAECKVPTPTMSINSEKVKKLRVRQFQSETPKIARLVFELTQMTIKHDIAKDEHSVRVSFDEEAVQETTVKVTPDSKVPSATSTTASIKSPEHPEPARQVKSKSTERPAASSPLSNTTVTIPVAAKAGIQPPPTLAPAALAQAVVMLPEPKAASVPSTPSVEPNGRFFGKPLTLDLVDVSLVDFFRLMAEEGEINIVMDPEIKGTLSIKVVKVPWDQIFEAALTNNGLDKQIEGNLVRIARKSTLQDEAKQREALKKANLLAADLETRIKRLNYTKATGLIAALKEHQSVRGTVAIDERTNSLVMSDIPASLDKMVALVETLDIPQPQVEIEARIVSATRDFARDIGIQFGFVQGNLQRVTVGGPNTFGTIGGTRPSSTPTSTFAAGNPITGRGASQDQSSQSAGVSTGSSNKGNFNVNLPSQTPFGGLGISVGNIFDTFLLDAAITAGETKGLAKLISQPKVTAQNNSPATITQGLRFPVQIVANNTITVQFQNAALTLNVTPQITLEGNIVLDLKIENNTPDFGQTVNGIPSIRTSESATRVLVSDGGTTVIGGILIDNETTQEDRVPGLASLPIVGNVFRRQAVSHNTQEVLFFITPRVIK